MKRITRFLGTLIALMMLSALSTALAADNGFFAYAKGTTNTYVSVTTEPGEDLTMSVDASCSEGELHYQWRLGSEIVDGATQMSYTTSVIDPYIPYYCDVTDDYGNSTFITFWAHVNNDLQIQAKGSANPKVAPGETLTLTVDASCKAGNIHYKWASNNQIIEGATGASFTTGIINAQTSYECYVTDDYHNSGTVFFNVSIDNELRARQIGYAYGWNTTSSTTSYYKDVNFGSSVTLKVEAECKVGSVHYQWIKGGSYINDKTTTLGATEANYTIEAIQATDIYCCIVTDDYGSTVRVPFSVTIDNGLTAKQIGDSVNEWGDVITKIDPNETATLTVEASCNNGEVHYQWYDNLSKLIEGATESSYTTDALPYVKWSSYRYECRVTDDYGNIVHVWCSVNVSNDFWAKPVDDSSWSADLEVKPGEPATLEVEASCKKGEIHYEWRSGSSSGPVIEDAMGPRFITEPINALTEYYCIVTDDFGGEIPIRFIVGVDNGLWVEEDGFDIYVAPHGSTTLEVVAKCERGDLQYTWYRSKGWNSETIDGETGPTLSIEDITSDSYYYCHVTDQYGNTQSAYFDVYVNNNFYARRLSDYEVLQPLGESVTLEITAGCDVGNVHYKWRKNNIDIEGENNSACVVPPVTQRAYYSCIVTDDFGGSKDFYFSVVPDNGLVVERNGLPEDISVPYGETLTLKITARCNEGSLKYHWYDTSGSFIEDADGLSIKTEPITENCDYSVRVIDEYDNDVYVYFYISVDNDFSAEADGETVVIRKSGMPATLKVKATRKDDQPLSYRWYGPEYDERYDEWEEMSYIKGADEASFTLAEDSAFGTYRCDVEDQYGNWAEVTFEVKQENDYSVKAICDEVLYLSSGQSANLGVAITGPSDQVHFRWYHDASYTNDALIEDANDATYTTPPLTGTTGFWCVAEGPYGRNERFNFLCVVEEEFLALDQTVEVDFGSGDARYYSFTPKKTGQYVLEPGGFVHIELYDANMKYLENNDHGDNSPFHDLTENLTAGQKYIYKVSKNGWTQVKGMTLNLTCLEEQADTYNLTLLKGQTVILPGTASGDVVTVETKDSAIASVSGKAVEAVTVGTTEVYVTYADGGKALYEVSVFDEDVITLPVGLRYLKTEAFAGDDNLRFVVLGDVVENVEERAFDGSGLRQIVISSTTTNLNRNALKGVDNPTIICQSGSHAEEFAKSNSLTYAFLK